MKNTKRRWKKIMAFCLAFVMIFGMTVSVNAANGPNEASWSTAFIIISDGAANKKCLYSTSKTETISKLKNVSYDKKTNTLTLNGYQEAEKSIITNEMGDDFKVKVVGNNKIQGITVWGYYYGGSLTLEGKGTLEINKNRKKGGPVFLQAEESSARFKVKQGVTLKVYSDNKVSSIAVSYSAAAKDGIVFDGNDTLNKKVRKTSQKEVKQVFANVYESRQFIPCTPKDSSVKGTYGALKQDGSSDDEPYYNIYKIQKDSVLGIPTASHQDEDGNYFWQSNFNINTNGQKIKAYMTSLTRNLDLLQKKTATGKQSGYAAAYIYDTQKGEVCSIYKIIEKDNKPCAVPVESEQKQPLSILNNYEAVTTGKLFYNYEYSGDAFYTGNQNTKPGTTTKKPATTPVIKVVVKGTTLKKVTPKKKKLVATWKKQSKIIGYQLQYSTDKKFKKKVKTINIPNKKTTSKTITKLKSKKKYFVRIRTYQVKKVNGKDKNYYSAWSKMAICKVK